MKISNETKIGIMAVVGVAMLVIGFKYLKGSGIFKKENRIYAVYADVQGLKQSNPVVINGMQVGRIENLDGGKDMKRILVTIRWKHTWGVHCLCLEGMRSIIIRS